VKYRMNANCSGVSPASPASGSVKEFAGGWANGFAGEVVGDFK